MFDFYKKKWFPYVCPFFVIFTMAQVSVFLPQWESRLFVLQTIICATLLWAWRHHYHLETIKKISVGQIAICITFACLELSIWLALTHFDLIAITQRGCQTSPVFVIDVIVKIITIIGFTMIIPVVTEIFWRSFMLRYLIDPDFTAIKLGSFQLFSFTTVIILSSFTSDYILAIAISALLQNILIVWQKNLLCCILSHTMTNILLTVVIFGYCDQLL